MAYIGKGITGEFTSSDFSSISFIGDGSTTVYTLPGVVTTSDESVLVHIDGVKQHISAYSILSGNLLAFSAPPPNAAAIEAIIFGVQDLIQIYTVPEDSISVRELDTIDGSSGQVLTTDGVGNLSFSETAPVGYTSKTITVNTTIDSYTEYDTGSNFVVNNSVQLTIPTSSQLVVKYYASGKLL